MSYRGAHFDIAVAPGTTTKYTCIIAKKRIRRAVDRNKTRRKVYEALHSIQPSSSSVILIYPTKQALFASVTSIQKELQTVFATL